MKSNCLFWNKIILPGVLILLLGAATDFSRAQSANPETTNSVPDVTNAIPVLQIQADKVTAHVSPVLYGLMTEEINFSYEGGLYGELIRNRTFKADATNAVYWSTVGGGQISIDASTPLNDALNVSLKLDAAQASANSPAGFSNGGFWGIPVRPDTQYHASFFAKADGIFSGALTLNLQSADGKTLFASATVSGLGRDWKKFDVTLTTKDVAPSKDNQFTITTTSPGTIWFQQVSLFPPTFNNRPNGNRPDIMQLLADMKPKFLRFPGGNYLEGNEISNRFDWKKTIGDTSQRPGHMDDGWGYWSTDGFGLLEFLEWCEDLKMQPLLAVYAGYSMHQRHVDPGTNLDFYVQEALDEIEYVTGDTNTKWGAERAKDGHPAPFTLNYVEVGNEDWFDKSGSYGGRFAQFYDAIKAKYPQLQIICSSDRKMPDRVPDVIDQHLYPSSEGAMEVRAHEFDTRKRNGPKTFVGEWATRVGTPTPDFAGALGDAAWMTGMERNSDQVIMSCYAPLFVNVSDLKNPSRAARSMQWPSDLIGYDALNSYGSPSYYAQKMFNLNRGDQVLAVDSQNIPTYTFTGGRGRGGQPPAPQQVPSLFFDATRDSQSGIIFLKIVNRNATPQSVHVKISGVSSVEAEGDAVVMKADGPDDTNSIQEPTKIVPVPENVDGLGTDFTRDFPPFSITVLKLKTN
jgi:alpha-N-arabinofuranosidase